MQQAIPVVIMRGGTSRGLFFHERDLPVDTSQRDEMLLQAIGSPDPYRRQIDGLGGATSSTSKIVVVRPSSRPGIDVEYLFGQVSITEPRVDYSGNCGNLSSAVGPFAIDEGLVASTDPTTTLRLFNLNTEKTIVASIPVRDGCAEVNGAYAIDGVPGTGAPIALTYQNPGGAVTGNLLPTGRACDRLDVAGLGVIDVSIVDAANPVVFVRASALDLTATELPQWIDAHPALLTTLEAVRRAAATALGYAEIPEAIRVAFVGPPTRYTTTRGAVVESSAIDLTARIISLGRAHHAYTMTGAICTAVAALVPGTIVNGQAALPDDAPPTIRIGHAAGTIEIGVRMAAVGDEPEVESVTTFRTARRLAQGVVYVAR